MTEKTIRVVYKEPGKNAEIREIPNTLDEFQKLVGGFIETVTLPPVAGGCHNRTAIIICDEEGKLKGAKPNFFCGAIHDMICGPVVVTGENAAGDDFGDLSEHDAKGICEQLRRCTGEHTNGQKR